MHKLELNAYKNSIKDESPSWKVLKCVTCNFQLKMTKGDLKTDIHTNMPIEDHQHSEVIQVKLSKPKDPLKVQKPRIEKHIKALINPLIHTGAKNVQITAYLKDSHNIEASKIPNADQLNRFRAYYKEKRLNEITNKDKGTFTQWILENQINKEDLTKCFVVDYILESNKFIFILSSLQLLQNAMIENQYESGYVCIDSTYKLTTCKFPLLIIATRGKDRHLRIIAFAILSHENIESFMFIIKSLMKCMKTELNFDWRIQVSFFLILIII